MVIRLNQLHFRRRHDTSSSKAYCFIDYAIHKQLKSEFFMSVCYVILDNSFGFMRVTIITSMLVYCWYIVYKLLVFEFQLAMHNLSRFRFIVVPYPWDFHLFVGFNQHLSI